MPRVLLIVPDATYRAPDFLAAARALEVDVVVGSETAPTLAATMGDRSVVLPLCDPVAAVDAIAAVHDRGPLDAIVAVDDTGAMVAALASERLGLRHNPPASVAATRDKLAMRRALAAGGVHQPRFEDGPGTDVGFPCVVKPAGLAASRGVIRADDATERAAAITRVGTITDGPLIVEQYVAGLEVALEGILDEGALTVLAVFDKPDPLEGPYFEETIYVTPSRQRSAVLAAIEQRAQEATRALGLREGPVHAELRVHGDDIAVVEVAARSIGGLCARTLRFGAGVALEELILRHALGRSVRDLAREPAAAGVMMLPIARAGTLVSVQGQQEALAVPGIVGLELTIHPGRPVVPLPEGDRYLGFLFARGATADGVESALRVAHARLDIVIA